jgi:hypothetical protein
LALLVRAKDEIYARGSLHRHKFFRRIESHFLHPGWFYFRQILVGKNRSVPFSLFLQRIRGISLITVVRELQKHVLGWHGYFSYAEEKAVFRELDSGLGRRLRCYLWDSEDWVGIVSSSSVVSVVTLPGTPASKCMDHGG